MKTGIIQIVPVTRILAGIFTVNHQSLCMQLKNFIFFSWCFFLTLNAKAMITLLDTSHK